MNKLDENIKDFNIAFTDTLENEDFFRIDYSKERIDINYDDCISLYDLVSSFNKMHTEFKKEYDELDKFDLGKEIDFEYFHKGIDDLGNIYRLLSIYIQKPNIIDESYTFLQMREVNGVSMPYITNNKGSYLDDSGCYRKPVRLDAKTIKNYLNLFEKYNLLLELYHNMLSKYIYSDDSYCLFTDIHSQNDKFTDDLKSLKFCFYSDNFADPHDRIIMIVKLGEELSFDLNNSCIILNEEDLLLTEEICTDFLKRVHINGKYLEGKSNSKRKYKQPKVKMLINNIE